MENKQKEWHHATKYLKKKKNLYFGICSYLYIYFYFFFVVKKIK
jgi:hypothetical protein